MMGSLFSERMGGFMLFSAKPFIKFCRILRNFVNSVGKIPSLMNLTPILLIDSGLIGSVINPIRCDRLLDRRQKIP
jgi:hypothetical protein